MQWTIENMWTFHIQPHGTPFSSKHRILIKIFQIRQRIANTYVNNLYPLWSDMLANTHKYY